MKHTQMSHINNIEKDERKQEGFENRTGYEPANVEEDNVLSDNAREDIERAKPDEYTENIY